VQGVGYVCGISASCLDVVSESLADHLGRADAIDERKSVELVCELFGEPDTECLPALGLHLHHHDVLTADVFELTFESYTCHLTSYIDVVQGTVRETVLSLLTPENRSSNLIERTFE
jgi:hypothetical protein